MTFALLLGQCRRRPLQLLLCVVGIALGVTVAVGIEAAVAASVSSFRGAVEAMLGRATHSLVRPEQTLPYADVSAFLRTHPSIAASPLVDRRAALFTGDDHADAVPAHDAANAGTAVDEVPRRSVVRVLGIDVFTDSRMRPFLQDPAVFSGEALGRFVTGRHQVVLASTLAAEFGLTAGDELRLNVGTRVVDATVLGVLTLPSPLDVQLGDALLVDMATADAWFDLSGGVDRIDLRLESAADVAAVEKGMPSGWQLVSASQQAATLTELMAAYRMNLTALSMMASFVALFIVYNAMLVSVRQREPMLATLRCLGATGWQIGLVHVVETLACAAVGGGLGLLGGYALSGWLVDLVATSINDHYAFVRPAPVWPDVQTVSLGVGIAVLSALAGAAWPIFTAARTPPATGLRATNRSERQHTWATRSALAGVCMLAGCPMLMLLPASWPQVGHGMALLAAGGTALLCPVSLQAMAGLVRAAASRLGRGRWLAATLAAGSVSRSLETTGIAAAALMLALAMTIGIQTMVGSFRQSLESWFAQRYRDDVFVVPLANVGFRADAALDGALIAHMKADPRIQRVNAFRQRHIALAGKPTRLTATDLASLATGGYLRFREQTPELGDLRLRLAALDGSAANPLRTVVVISEPLAGRRGLRAGDTFELPTPLGPVAAEVAGVYFDFGTERGEVIIDQPIYRRLFNDQQVNFVHLRLADPAQAERLALAWAAEWSTWTPVSVKSNASVRAAVLEIFERTFAVTHVLTWLAALVAFCGLLGALVTLSLGQRPQVATLSAMGISSRQIAAWVAAEGLLVAWTAAIVSWVCGTASAYILAGVIQLRSFGWSIPVTLDLQTWAQTFIIATAAALCAVLVPLWQIRRRPIADALHEP